MSECAFLCAISLFLFAGVHCEFMNITKSPAPVLVTRGCAYKQCAYMEF